MFIILWCFATHFDIAHCSWLINEKFTSHHLTVAQLLKFLHNLRMQRNERKCDFRVNGDLWAFIYHVITSSEKEICIFSCYFAKMKADWILSMHRPRLFHPHSFLIEVWNSSNNFLLLCGARLKDKKLLKY